jgi:methyl-accepting chemotaxis protein
MLAAFRLRSIRDKLMLATAILILPSFALLGLFTASTAGSLGMLRQERTGQLYMATFGKLATHLEQRRSAAELYLAGDRKVAQSKSELAARTAEVSNDISALDEIDGQNGSGLAALASWTALKKDWELLSAGTEKLTPAESFRRHTSLVTQLLALIDELHSSQTMSLAPDTVSYHSQRSLRGLLASSEYLGQSVLLASRPAPKEIGSSESREMELTLLRAIVAKEGVETDVREILRARPELAPTLAKLWAEYETRFQTSIDMIRTVMSRPDGAVSEIRTASTTVGDTTAKGLDLYTMNDRLFGTSLDERIRAIYGRITLALGVIGIGILAALVAVTAVSRGITRQTSAIVETLSEVGIGNFDARSPVITSDELATIAETINSLLENTLGLIQSQEERDEIRASVDDLARQVEIVAGGDLTLTVEPGSNATAPIAEAINDMIGQLRAIIAEVQGATERVGQTAEQIDEATQALNRSAEAQATQIEETSQAVEQIAVSTQQVAENTEQSLVVAELARSRARAGATSVRDTIAGMDRIRDRVQDTSKRIKRLGEGSQSIGEIVQMIGDIADRTSILALNASIQAAMAGEAGLGFAVVAEEVERLAERSNEATRQITSLVKAIQVETGEAISAMEESTREVVHNSGVALQAGQALSEIDTVSAKLAGLIQAVAAATKKQARGAEAIAHSMGEISDLTQHTADGSRQAADTVTGLTLMAQELREAVSTFQLPSDAQEDLSFRDAVPAPVRNGHAGRLETSSR